MATFRARMEVPRTTRATGRAISARSTNRPSEVSTERKTAQRAISRRVVVAVSLSEGTRNCGGGPGFGPTANVNAPRTGWPSAEIRRQKTRYQPSGTRFSGITHLCAEPGAAQVDDLAVRVGLPHLERVGLVRAHAAVEAEDGVLVGRYLAAAPGHLLDHAFLTRAGGGLLALPAGRGLERVDREALWDGQL